MTMRKMKVIRKRCRYDHRLPRRIPAGLTVIPASHARQSCADAVSRMFPAVAKKSKKARKSEGAEGEPEPVDVLVDTVIGFLDQATAYMRAVANQVFALLSSSVQESTIDLILAVSATTSPLIYLVNTRFTSRVVATRAERSRGTCGGRGRRDGA